MKLWNSIDHDDDDLFTNDIETNMDEDDVIINSNIGQLNKDVHEDP